MEPNETASEKNLGGSPSAGGDDLHSEGIDIVGSSVALDNEFSKPEEEAFSSGAAVGDTVMESAASDQALKELEADADEVKPQPVVPLSPIVPKPLTPPVQPPVQPVVAPARPVEQRIPPVQPQAPQVPPMSPKIGVQNDPSIKQLRTFKSDAEEAVKYGGATKVSIAVAEQKRREANNTPITYENDHRASPGLYIGILAVIIVLLGGGWFYWFKSSQTPAQQGKIVAPQVNLIGIVPFAKAAIVVLDPSSDTLSLVAAKIGASVPALGTVGAIAPVASADATTMSPVDDVIAKTRIPSRLARSLDSAYMVGSYEYDVQSPFIILKNTFFQNAFSGMLEWEKDLAADFISFIQISSPGTTIAVATGASFEDGIVSNVNVRSLKDPLGKTILTYAFADKDTIVITTTDTALKYLLNQILQVRTIQ